MKVLQTKEKHCLLFELSQYSYLKLRGFSGPLKTMKAVTKPQAFNCWSEGVAAFNRYSLDPTDPQWPLLITETQ